MAQLGGVAYPILQVAASGPLSPHRHVEGLQGGKLLDWQFWSEGVATDPCRSAGGRWWPSGGRRRSGVTPSATPHGGRGRAERLSAKWTHPAPRTEHTRREAAMHRMRRRDCAAGCPRRPLAPVARIPRARPSTRKSMVEPQSPFTKFMRGWLARQRPMILRTRKNRSRQRRKDE